MKRIDVRLPDDYAQILDDYCVKTGANKTGTIKMLLQCLKDEDLLGIKSRHGALGDSKRTWS